MENPEDEVNSQLFAEKLSWADSGSITSLTGTVFLYGFTSITYLINVIAPS